MERVPFILRRLLIGLLIVGLTACSSTPVVTAPPPTNLPTVTAPTQSTAVPTVTGQINVSSLTGRIVSSADPPHGEIYVMNANGTELRQVTTDPADEFDPTWSPDGKQIAYRHQIGDDSQIYVINVDDSGATKLTTVDESRVNFAPAWSPDGTTIVWNSDLDLPIS